MPPASLVPRQRDVSSAENQVSVADILQKHVEAQTRPSRWEEAPVPFVADLGKDTRRRREQVRNQEQIADVRPPLQLRRVADDFPAKPP